VHTRSFMQPYICLRSQKKRTLLKTLKLFLQLNSKWTFYLITCTRRNYLPV
jgi:hypothetical protein